jgi:Flp pilus assembly protein TadG
MRRRGAVLVEFGLVAGILIVLLSTVFAFYPAIAARTAAIDAAFASALELSTYQAPSDAASATLRSVGTQQRLVCRNAGLVARRMLDAAGLPIGTVGVSDCGAPTWTSRVGIVVTGFRLRPGTSVPASPFTLCVTYRYQPDGGISYVMGSGGAGVDVENLTYIHLRACTAVYLDDDRTETP